MDSRKSNKKSIKRVVSRAILLGSCIFIVLAIFLEMVLLVFSTMESYKREAEHDANYLMAIVDQEYLEGFVQKIKDLYYNTPEEIRHEQFDDITMLCVEYKG